MNPFPWVVAGFQGNRGHSVGEHELQETRVKDVKDAELNCTSARRHASHGLGGTSVMDLRTPNGRRCTMQICKTESRTFVC